MAASCCFANSRVLLSARPGTAASCRARTAGLATVSFAAGLPACNQRTMCEGKSILHARTAVLAARSWQWFAILMPGCLLRFCNQAEIASAAVTEHMSGSHAMRTIIHGAKSVVQRTVNVVIRACSRSATTSSTPASAVMTCRKSAALPLAESCLANMYSANVGSLTPSDVSSSAESTTLCDVTNPSTAGPNLQQRLL